MRVAVIGGGYVGLVTATCLAAMGNQIMLVEQHDERRKMIRDGRAPFFEPHLEDLLSKTLTNGTFIVTDDLASAVQESEITFIAVGTPFGNGAIDLTQVSAAAKQIGAALRDVPDYHTVVVKSTVVPGTTDTVVREILETESGMKVGKFGLCMNPEFLREGSAVEDFQRPDRIVIGQHDERSGDSLVQLYSEFDCPWLRMTLRNAELTKYANNALLALLISFSNEIATICETTHGTDVEVVMDGLHLDKRLSPRIQGRRIEPHILSYLRAGCGFGGSCLPKDVEALRAYAGEIKASTPMLDAIISVNKSRPQQVVRMLEDAVGSLAGKTVAVLGLAFKPHTDDTRDSPALTLIQQLSAKKAHVRAYDPMVEVLPDGIAATQVTCSASVEEAIANADAVVIATAWPHFADFDWASLSGKMAQPVIVDGRRLLDGESLPSKIKYLPIGRSIGKNATAKAAQPEKR